MNIVILTGNTGKDPEVKSFDNGNKCAAVSLATSKMRKDAQGNKIQDTQWHNLVTWNKTAEVWEKYLKKGTKISIRGEIVYRSWEVNGEKKYITEIVVQEFEFLSSSQEKPHDIGEGEPDDLPF